MSDETHPDVAISLEKIVVESFQFRGPLSGDPGEAKEPFFKIGRHWSFSSTTELIRIVFKIVLSETEDDGGVELAELGVRYDYRLKGLAWKLDDEGKEEILRIPEPLLETLFSIAYSTTRGILYEKARGTSLDSLILPIVVPKELIPENSLLEHRRPVKES